MELPPPRESSPLLKGWRQTLQPGKLSTTICFLKRLFHKRLPSACQCTPCFPAGLSGSRESVIQSAFKKIFSSSLVWAFLTVSTSLPRDDSLSVQIIQLMRFSPGNTDPGLS